jgi:heme exporter protein A
LFNRSLTIENLSASRGGFVLFEGVSFSLKPAEALRITGPNGSGKTTLLRCLAGLVRADSGSISSLDQSSLYYVGHLNAMKPQLTVAENLNFWAAIDGSKSIEAAIIHMNLARLVDLPFSVLSSGQKRRVALARLLLSARQIWLLDEPTVGLDAASISLVESLLEQHLFDGGMVIAATHMPLGNANWQTLELQPLGAMA